MTTTPKHCSEQKKNHQLSFLHSGKYHFLAGLDPNFFSSSETSAAQVLAQHTQLLSNMNTLLIPLKLCRAESP